MREFALGLAIALAASLALPWSAVAGTGPPACSVELNKRVRCKDPNAGGAFADSCAALDGEQVDVLYVVRSGDDALLNCAVWDDNAAISAIIPGNPFDVPAGSAHPVPVIPVTCTDEFELGEPDMGSVRCDCATPDVDGNPRTVTAMDGAGFECRTCSVSLDKQVDCGDGYTSEFCVALGESAFAPADDVSIRWIITNTGEDGVSGCQLRESNHVVIPDEDQPLNIPNIPAGTQRIVAPRTFACTEKLIEPIPPFVDPPDDPLGSSGEPDTARLIQDRCKCATRTYDDGIVSLPAVSDTADFVCQVGLVACVPTDNFTGPPTIDYKIVVPAGDAAQDCVVEDALVPGTCPSEVSFEPTLTQVGTVQPDTAVDFSFYDNTVDELSCNVAAVECQIVGCPSCDPFTKTDEALCTPPPPLPACLQAEKNLLSLQSEGKLKWKWKKGGSTSKADFGDPTSDTAYRVCLYDGSGATQAAPLCTEVPAGSGWEDKKNGYVFKSNGGADGITGIRLVEGESGKARILVKGVYEGGLPLASSVTVQISNSHDVCWESSFSGSQVKKNDGKKFKAKAKNP